MNEEKIKLSNKELQKCLDELQGTNFLNAFCVLDWILKTRKENKELQKENQSLRTRIKTIKRRRKHQTQKLNKYKLVVTDLRNALEKKNNKIDKANATIDTNLELIEHLGNKIDKAIEYINKNKYFYSGLQNEDMEIGLFENEINELLEILKDSNVNE